MINKNKRDLKERLDRIGVELIRSASLTEAEVEDGPSSAWHFTRLRARIAAESERHEASERWSTILTVVRQAVPATAMAAAVAFGSFLVGGSNRSPSTVQFSDQDLLTMNDSGVEQMMFADQRTPSSDEVMETIISEERETTK